MATSLLDWIMDLMRQGDAREAFDRNPQDAMASAGFTNICGEDIADSRAFLFDNPNIREVKDADRSDRDERDFDDAPDQIRYIVNNYTFEAPKVTPPGVVPDDPGPTFEDVEEIEDSFNETETEANTETETETETEVGNVVTGNGSAGEDRNSDSTANESDNTLGDGVITLNDTIDMGNIEVLSHIVEDNLNNNLNDSFNDSLNDSVTNIANDTLGSLVSLI